MRTGLEIGEAEVDIILLFFPFSGEVILVFTLSDFSLSYKYNLLFDLPGRLSCQIRLAFFCW